MGINDLGQDLNQTIASAVNARIEAQVLAALSGDETIAQFVSAALQQPVEVDRYSSKRTTYLANVIDSAIKKATQSAVAKVIDEESSQIEASVRSQLVLALPDLAKSLVASAQEVAKSSYRINVNVQHIVAD